ncbi:hypothetical protein ACQ859_16375 [Roseateles chitinivorans]|uniref:hypothetical protein n=1 Tax=Roseateles chitinivorans TaxID=2917965 RepID=UPI003D677E29
MVNFPVLQRVRVSDYALYVGTPEQPGLDHSFVDGVNVIVGINGLGKTTLLNMLLRSLTGPTDVPADESLGDTRRRLIPSDRAWFRKRVPDDAVDAKVTVWFTLGVHFFEVTRSLANLDILEMHVDQQAIPVTRSAQMEGTYKEMVRSASGLASFDDFVFLLRYIVFYLEDRRSLVWDQAAQGEILSILFGDTGERRTQYVKLFNALLSKDSEYRNMHAVVFRQRRKVEQQTTTIEGGQIEMAIQTLEARRDDLKALTQRKNELASTRDGLRGQMENRRQEIYDKRTDLASQLNAFYGSFFPNLSQQARYLLAKFEAGGGCLVCGSKSPSVKEKIEGKLYMNTCPVCDSPLEQNAHEGTAPHAGEAIEQKRAEIVEAEADLLRMEQPLRDAEAEYSQVSAALVAATARVVELEQQVKALGENLPEVMQRREALKDGLLAFEAALNNLEVERQELSGQFKEIAEAIDQEVRAVSAQVEAAFSGYISGFLAEECAIKYAPRVRPLGQRTGTDEFPFPHFIPALTSGAHRDGATVREAGQSVSESQKEFIDLAFRMALLALASPGAPTMLILETPEASLDSVFVPRAADLLRRFATKSDAAQATRLIASSNVNREEMIPALFGVHPDPRFYEQVVDDAATQRPRAIPAEDRHEHVLDLLKIAAPTRALERFRAAYEQERDHAIYPERRALEPAA